MATLGGLAILIAVPAAAQELEPRAYSPAPVGTTFVVAGLTRSAGSVVTDPSLPLQDVDAKVIVAAPAVGHTFGLAGKQSLILFALPVSRATATGRIGENVGEVQRTGLADARVKLSVNLAGAPAMSLAEFARAPRRTVVGVSLTASLPIGQYDRTKLVNLGSHRWAFKPEVGVSQPLGRWTVDGYLGAWFFTENDQFYTGDSVRSQDPIVSLQAHVSYTLKPRAWVAFDSTWYRGGRTTVDDALRADLQKNTRIGTTLAWPVGRRQSLKFSYNTGATTSIGADFDTYGVAWQITVF